MSEMITDIGTDLGTATVIIYVKGKGIVLKEPSVVAYDTRSGKVLCVGQEAYTMIGRTPDRIRAVKPLDQGVISDNELCEKMLQHFLKKVYQNALLKPRVALCVPSAITDVESRAVVEAAVKAGARKVYLIEEPVAAAIGAKIDISKPSGHLVLDIGGGTADIAVLSLNGIVQKESIKLGGDKFDQAVVRYLRERYGLLIGEKMAEMVKREIGTVGREPGNEVFDVKGRNLTTGLPEKRSISAAELRPCLLEIAQQIVSAMQSVLERTPPELVGDIFTSGAVMTGGGSLLRGLDELIEEKLHIKAEVAESAEECVAIGTGCCFDFIDELSEDVIRYGSGR